MRRQHQNQFTSRYYSEVKLMISTCQLQICDIDSFSLLMFPQRTIVVIMKEGKTYHSFYFTTGT